MKDVIITILTILVLGLGGFLFYDNFIEKKEEKPIVDGNKVEQYTLLAKNDANVQYLYKGSKGVRAVDKVYTTSNLKVSDRTQADKYCSVLEVTKGYNSYYEYDFLASDGSTIKQSGDYYTVNEEDLKMSYEKIFGPNTYKRISEFNCLCAKYIYNDNKYRAVEDGCGFTSSYNEMIEEVRKYNDRIEISAIYYYHKFDIETETYCTDENCAEVILENSNGGTAETFISNYKDRLNRLIYTYELSEDGYYYFTSTKINK